MSGETEPSDPEISGAHLHARRRRAGGCLIAFLGMAAMTLTPAIGRWVEIAPRVANGILLLALVLLLAGAVLGIMGAPEEEPPGRV